MIRAPVKIHGGKSYLAKWVVSNFPANYQELNYLEPFVGAGSVLFAKTPSPEESINDLNLGIVQIFRALRDEPNDFIGRIKHLKYCEETFKKALIAQIPFNDYLDHAVNEYVLRRMSRGGLKKSFAWSERLRGGQPGDLNAWKTASELLPTLAERVRHIHIFNRPALDIIKQFSSPKTVLYCDPPYLHETRVSKNAYEEEMTTQDHVKLAEILHSFRGKVVISGYASTLYNSLFKGWKCVKKSVANHASQQKTKTIKVEQLWRNF